VACSIAVLFRLGAGCFLFSCTCIYDGTACTLFIYLPISKKKNFLKLKEFIWKFRIHTTIDEIFTFNCSCFTALNLSLTEVNCIKFKEIEDNKVDYQKGHELGHQNRGDN
jgi:hypothetical protein